MSQSQAMRSGLSAIFRQPAIYFAELACRWAFGMSAVLLSAYALLAYFDTLEVSDLDLYGLSGVIPGMSAAALRHIFSGSGPALLRAGLSLALGLGFLWWITSTLGRGVTLAALQQSPRAEFRSVATFSGYRLLLFYLSVLALIGAGLMAAGRSQSIGGMPGTRTFYAILIPLSLLILLIVSRLNWYLSLAPMVAGHGPSRTGSVIKNVVVVARTGRSQFAWVGFAIGALRIVFMTLAAFLFLVVMSLALRSPAILGWAAIVVFAAFYSAISTFLQVVKVAAQVRILEWERGLGPFRSAAATMS